MCYSCGFDIISKRLLWRVDLQQVEPSAFQRISRRKNNGEEYYPPSLLDHWHQLAIQEKCTNTMNLAAMSSNPVSKVTIFQQPGIYQLRVDAACSRLNTLQEGHQYPEMLSEQKNSSSHQYIEDQQLLHDQKHSSSNQTMQYWLNTSDNNQYSQQHSPDLQQHFSQNPSMAQNTTWNLPGENTNNSCNLWFAKNLTHDLVKREQFLQSLSSCRYFDKRALLTSTSNTLGSDNSCASTSSCSLSPQYDTQPADGNIHQEYSYQQSQDTSQQYSPQNFGQSLDVTLYPKQCGTLSQWRNSDFPCTSTIPQYSNHQDAIASPMPSNQMHENMYQPLSVKDQTNTFAAHSPWNQTHDTFPRTTSKDSVEIQYVLNRSPQIQNQEAQMDSRTAQTTDCSDAVLDFSLKTTDCSYSDAVLDLSLKKDSRKSL